MKTFAKIIAIFILLLCIAGCASLLQNNNKASIESISNNQNIIEEQSSSIVSVESTINSQFSALIDDSENIKSAIKPISQQELLTQITSALNFHVTENCAYKRWLLFVINHSFRGVLL